MNLSSSQQLDTPLGNGILPYDQPRDLDKALTVCDRERIHEIGTIQELGWVIIIEEDDLAKASGFRISAISDNVGRAEWSPSKDAGSFLGHDMANLFQGDALERILDLYDRLAAVVPSKKGGAGARLHSVLRLPLRSDPRGSSSPENAPGEDLKDPGDGCLCVEENAESTHEILVVNCSMSVSGMKNWLLEIEEPISKHGGQEAGGEGRDVAISGLLQTGDIISRIRLADSLEAVTAMTCNWVLSILPEFDRGMVYRFADDLSGEVVYEKVQPHRHDVVKSSYLNLRFPAGDLPLPARLMYLKDRLRFISDCEGPESRMLGPVSQHAAPGSKLDLSMCSFRGTAKVHITYMRNMGVRSSMSLAIIVDENLWGLYSFHSYTGTVKITTEQRLMFESAAAVSSTRVFGFQRQGRADVRLRLSQALMNLTTSGSLEDFVQANHQQLLYTLRAHCVMICRNFVEYVAYGDKTIALPVSSLRELDLRRESAGAHVLTLTSYNPTRGSDTGVGVALMVWDTVALIFVRKCRVHDQKWAGRPDEPKIANAQGQLHPRASFDVYKEKGRKESETWTELDMEMLGTIADRVRVHLFETQSLINMKDSLEKSNNEAVKAVKQSRELQEFFAHMSHELRTPFHGVMASLQLLVAGAGRMAEDERTEIVESALECGDVMLTTLNDILLIAKNNHAPELRRDLFDVATVISTTFHTMKQFARGKGVHLMASISQSSPASLQVIGDRDRVKHVIQNLVNNAIKFTNSGGDVNLTLTILETFSEVKSMWNTDLQRYQNSLWSPGDASDPLENAAASSSARSDSLVETLSSSPRFRLGSNAEPEYAAEVTKHAASSPNLLGSGGGGGSGLASGTSRRGPSNGASGTKPASLGRRLSSSPNATTASGASASASALKLSKSSTYAPVTPRDVRWCVFSVEDTGVGVPADQLSSMLKAYEQLYHRAAQNTTQGTGLGLHICTMNVKSMGGAFGVASTPGSGTLFRCAIPLEPSATQNSDDSSAEHGREKEREDKSEAPTQKRARPTVFLVVDDSKLNLRLCSKKITLALGEDITVMTAMDGWLALQIVQQMRSSDPPVHITGIIMDKHMPGMSGVECTRRIRAMEAERGCVRPVPIIAFTADLTDVAREELKQAGSTAFLSKPSAAGELESICRELVRAEEKEAV
uniref:histidine kinase n=1 Tax=Ishige okamurae TaxID=233772 RepID=A0A0K1H3J6_9PHAE|nr:phytochrome [Ishige okamurae]